MQQPLGGSGVPMGRRRFLRLAGSRGAALGVAGVGLPTLLAACGDDDAAVGSDDGTTTTGAAGAEEAEAIVGDVVDFSLASDDWAGGFGFVTIRLRRGVFDGNDVYFVRTDASDQDYASAEQLVYVPKIASLAGDGLSGAAYVVEDGPSDQPTVFSSEPGQDDYTPAWTNVFMNGIEGPGPMGFQPSAFDHDAGDPAWSPYWDHFTYAWRDDATPRVLKSQTEIHEARDAGELDEFPGVPDTDGTIFTVNCPVPILAPATFQA